MGEGRVRLRKRLEDQGWPEPRLSVLFTYPLAFSALEQEGAFPGWPGSLCHTPASSHAQREVASAGRGWGSLVLLLPPLPCPHPPTLQRGSRPRQ